LLPNSANPATPIRCYTTKPNARMIRMDHNDIIDCTPTTHIIQTPARGRIERDIQSYFPSPCDSRPVYMRYMRIHAFTSGTIDRAGFLASVYFYAIDPRATVAGPTQGRNFSVVTCRLPRVANPLYSCLIYHWIPVPRLNTALPKIMIDWVRTVGTTIYIDFIFTQTYTMPPNPTYIEEITT